MQIPFSSVYIVFANYEKIRIYFLYTLLEIYGKKKITGEATSNPVTIFF